MLPPNNTGMDDSGRLTSYDPLLDRTPDIIDPTGNYKWDKAAGMWVLASTGGPKTPGQGLLPGDPGTYDKNGNYVPIAMATGDHAAADTTASILRGNYENWKAQYFPRIGELMNMTSYNNPNLVNDEVAKSGMQVADSFDAVRGSQARNVARYGMNLTAEAISEQDDAMKLAQSTATVDAENRTRRAIDDRNRAIAAGGLPAAVAGGR